MLNRNKLRGRMAEKDFSQRRLAKELHINENTFSSKMKNGDFTIEQVDKLCELLDIDTPEDKCDIFLTIVSQ